MDNIDEVASCFEDCAAEEISQGADGQRRLQQPVRSDLCAARPAHSAFWWPFAPYAVDGGPDNWDKNRADYCRAASWTSGANMPSTLTTTTSSRSYLFTPPLDVERLNVNMRQGAVRMGAYVPNQLGINRPHPLMPGSRTPVEGLYLCGSSSGNGGGVNGAPGLYRGQRDCGRSETDAQLDAGGQASVEASELALISPLKEEG